MIGLLIIPAVFGIIFGIAKAISWKSQRDLRDKIRRTIPDFDLPITSDILENNFKIVIAGVKVFVKGTLSTTKAGFMGYKMFTINGVNESFDVKLGFGFDLFTFWQGLKKFEQQIVANGATFEYTFSVNQRLKELEKDVEQMDNLKLMEERAEKSN